MTANASAGQHAQGRWERPAAFLCGVVFLLGVGAVAIFIPRPTEFQILIFRIVVAVAAAGIGAIVPGLLVVHVGSWVRAGGAIALFVLIYQFNPPVLVTDFTPYDEALRRGEAQLASGGYDSALTFFEKARQARPESWEPYYGMGRVYYSQAKYSSALEGFQRAFTLSGMKDGSLAYGIEMAHEGLGQYDRAEEDLKVADKLLTRDTPLYGDVVFDRGLLSLIQWIEHDAPRTTNRYNDAEQAFREFIELGYQPQHWALYNLSCLHATHAQDAPLATDEKQRLIIDSNQQLEHAVRELASYASAKGPVQRQMMRRLLQAPQAWSRKPGEPIACPALVQNWISKKGPISNLTSQIE